MNRNLLRWLSRIGLVFLAIILAVGTIFVLLHLSSERIDEAIPPEKQELLPRYNEIKDDMTRDETDSIFEGFTSGRNNGISHRKANGDPLTRPSSFDVMYTKKDAFEYDYFVRVYFDESGYVVGKEIGEILK
jgi:hypothetical protein